MIKDPWRKFSSHIPFSYEGKSFMQDETLFAKRIRIGRLYDVYGSLLTVRQQKIMEQYFYDDLSLGEIADAGGTSRQAVYDLLKRVEESLEKYEKKLRVLQKEESMQFELRGALHLLGALKEEGLGDERLQKIEDIIHKVMGDA